MSNEANATEEVQADTSGDIGGSEGAPLSTPYQEGPVDWRDNLSDDIRNSIDVDSLEDLAKGYVNAQQMIGGSIRIPGKDAGQEDWNKFYDKFSNVPGLTRYNPEDLSSLYEAAGRPKDPDSYKLDADRDVLEVFHSAGLNRQQAEAILAHQQAVDQVHSEAEGQEVDANINSLRQEWGMAFETKLAEGQRAVQFLEKSVPGLAAALDSSGAGNNPAMIKLFQTLGSNLSETEAFTNTSQGSNALTPYEARMQIDEILSNPQHPYHEGDEASTERFLELHKYANVG